MPFLLVLGIGFILIGLTYTTLIVAGRQAQATPGNWPTTRGTVEQSYVYEHEPRPTQDQPETYTPIVIFTYTVEEETYVAKQHDFSNAGEQTTSDLVAAEAIVKKYPPKSTVTVHYNPNSPSQAAIAAQKPTGYNTSLLVNVGNVVAGALIILVYALV